MARDLRRLTAIVSADATDHSRLMRRDAGRTESPPAGADRSHDLPDRGSSITVRD